MIQKTKTEIQKDLDNITTHKVFKMSLSIFVELLLQMLVGNIDQFMISQYSQNSVAAIGNGNQIMNIIIIVLNVMSSATTVLLTQYIGAKNKKMMSETCSASTMIILLAGTLATGVVVLFHRQIFTMMHVSPEIMEETCRYMKIIGSFIFIQGLYLNMASIIRSFSMMRQVMFVSVIMNLLNIIGNAILLNGFFGLPKLGITGVAISTNFSKCVGLLLLIIIFVRKIDAKIAFRYLKPFPFQTVKRILYIALPSGGEGLSYNMSQLVILSMVNTFGTAVVTTKVYASMIANVSYVYAIAIAQATQIVVGYMLGAGKKEQVSKRVWSTVRISFMVCVGVTIFTYLNSDFIYGIFTHEPAILELGKKILLIEILLECGRAMNIVLVRILCSTGDIIVPIAVGIVCQWFVAALLSYVFGVVLGLGLQGIWIAMALDECSRGIIFIFRFKSGAWKKKRVI